MHEHSDDKYMLSSPYEKLSISGVNSKVMMLKNTAPQVLTAVTPSQISSQTRAIDEAKTKRRQPEDVKVDRQSRMRQRGQKTSSGQVILFD